jgi:hypothetical protein
LNQRACAGDAEPRRTTEKRDLCDLPPMRLHLVEYDVRIPRLLAKA